MESREVHEYDTQINDLQFSPDRTYFITAGKDKSAKVRISFQFAMGTIDDTRLSLPEILRF